MRLERMDCAHCRNSEVNARDEKCTTKSDEARGGGRFASAANRASCVQLARSNVVRNRIDGSPATAEARGRERARRDRCLQMRMPQMVAHFSTVRSDALLPPKMFKAL
mmetsp:Transcript_3521/g.9698  ORF Transcript_3521/g.9698 Transcript_3521/m.9698 type:complete len:108 (+) Transcript_3521:1039-1362(+)